VPSVTPAPLADRLAAALDAGEAPALDQLVARSAGDRRDEALALSLVHDLHLAPLDVVGRRARWQHHPAVAALKATLESRLLARFDELATEAGADEPPPHADQAAAGSAEATVAAVRALAAGDLVPPLYDWVATEATADQLRWFLAAEGGPDGGFDDLVAICQVGLAGEPKLELAVNYWDEMGRGRAADVHTDLHRRLTAALDLAPAPRHELPVEALERSLLGSTLATNRWLQPEMVGALGLVELQAGPRCRRVATALRRVGAPADAVPFYQEHATADPRHGKDWLHRVIAPLAADPAWAAGIERGARWRVGVNRAFHRWAARELDLASEPGTGELRHMQTCTV
jgi:hypothetical protein